MKGIALGSPGKVKFWNEERGNYQQVLQELVMVLRKLPISFVRFRVGKAPDTIHDESSQRGFGMRARVDEIDRLEGDVAAEF